MKISNKIILNITSAPKLRNLEMNVNHSNGIWASLAKWLSVRL